MHSRDDILRIVRLRQIFIGLLLVSCVLVMSCRSGAGGRCMDALDGIDAIVMQEISEGHIPGAVVLAGRPGDVLYHKAFGMAVQEPYRQQMLRDAVFDLASLTKPVATATSIMILVDRGRMRLDDNVGKYLPAFGCAGKEEAEIRHLLTHTSGLPAYTSAAELQQECGENCTEAVIEKICSLEALDPPGVKFRYSCLGYITLAKIVEVVSGVRLDSFSRSNVFLPLGMYQTRFNPPASWRGRVAATEIVEGNVLRGTVHDPLARLGGGVSGNAGVFSTAGDLAVYCSMLLNDGVHEGDRILSNRAVEMLTKAQSHGRAFGFDVGSAYAWVKGSYASTRAYCHTGYTGTSIVCDPEAQTYLIILTNRVHPDDNGSTRSLRTQVANVVFKACR